jgi:aldehyde:ferredoxin oxidoreductase
MSVTGRILRIDLTTRRHSIDEIDRSWLTRLIGGRGIGIAYLLKELRPHVDPLSPENKLIFLPGVLSGTPAPGFARWVVCTKSPLTHIYGRSVCGGKFGAAIKIAGFDGIIVDGASEDLSYLYISKDGVRFLDATPLSSLDTQKTQRILRERHGRRAYVACIGEAGERLVKFSSIIHERRAAARCGVGAVMGSKRLKAIVVDTSGSSPPRLYRREPFLRVVREHNEVLKDHPRRKRMTQYGTTIITTIMHDLGIFPVRNFQEGRLEAIEALSAETFQTFKVKDYGCYACSTRCGNVFSVREGPYAGATSEGPEYETIFAFGGEIANTDPASIIYADSLCDMYGIDTISMGVLAGFLMELFERGIVSASELDGLEPRWGSASFLLSLMEKVVKREGVGDVLAEGVRRASEAIGRGSERSAMHVKGLELPGYEPRAAKAHGLNYATSNIGASHMYGYARQEISGYRVPREVDRLADRGKGDICGWNQIRKAFEETGILCNFADSNVTDDLLGMLYLEATGIEAISDPTSFERVGRRIVCLERLFNIREGLGRKEDVLPDRFLKEPLKNAGPSTGEYFRSFDELLDEYYEFMGFTKNGTPKEETIGELDLADFCEYL